MAFTSVPLANLWTAAAAPDSHAVRAKAIASLSDLVSWIDAQWHDVFVAVLLGFAIYTLANVMRSWSKRLCRKAAPGSVLSVIGRVIARTYQLFLILVSARLVLDLAGPPAWLHSVVHVSATVVTVFQAAIWLRELVIGLIQRRAEADHAPESLANAMGIIRLFVTVALFAVAAIVILDNVGVNVTGLVAGLGIGGIAIGLAAQGIFSDLFAALSILFDRPFVTGDSIGYDTTRGHVERIGLKSTRLRSVNGETKVISNKQLLDKEITNYTGLSRWRSRFDLALVYQTDSETARRLPEILKTIIEAENGQMVRAGFTKFGASSLDFVVEYDVFTSDWEVAFDQRHRIGIASLDSFRQQGIELAYPTQTTFTAAPDGHLVMPYLDKPAT